MHDLTAELWPAFELEVSEQLEQLEQLLARDGGGDIHSLFRLFHTIKSSCAMMAFGGMERIAHAAEDFLETVRRGSRELTPDSINVLLVALDALRRQMQEGMQTRLPPQAEPEIEALLRDLLGAQESAAAEPQGSATGEEAGLQNSVLVFCARSQELLPELAWACARQEELPRWSPLAEAADVAGLAVVSRLLQRLAEAAPDARLALVEELLARVRHIEQLGGEIAGVELAYIGLRGMLADRFRDMVQGVVAGTAGRLDNVAVANAWLDLMQPLWHFCRLLGLRSSERLLGLVRQVLRDMTREAVPFVPTLADQLGLALAIIAELPVELVEDEAYVALTEQLLENIQQEIAGSGNMASASTVAAPANIDEDALASLTPAARQQLDDSLAAGATVVEIDADLEAMPDGGAAFVEWLGAQGTPLGNRTVFRGAGREESTFLRFLAAFPLPLAVLAEHLAELDPDGSLLHMHVLNQSQSTEAPAAIVRPSPEAPAAAAKAAHGTVRVDSAALDGFVNRVGELVMLRNMIAHSIGDERLQDGLRRLRRSLASGQLPSEFERVQLLATLDSIVSRRENLLQTDARLHQTLTQLQGDALALRVVPVGTVFNRMTRVVWGLAQDQGKQVHIEIRGEDTRVDKGMIDVLAEPLSHMVRNAIDHGIELPEARRAVGKAEQAVLSLTAQQQGNALLITVSDDGRGLDMLRILDKARRLGLAGPQAYSGNEITQFIFAPGFSTAEQVTAVSGRGVGMDVVKTRIAQIGGQIEVSSRPGRGTTFTLRLPLSVAIQTVVLVEAGERLLALSERQVMEVISIAPEELQSVKGQAVCLLRGVVLPLYDLAQLLGWPAGRQEGQALHVVVYSDGRHRLGLVVRGVLGRQEVFVRDIHPDVLKLPGVGGACILGDGRVAIIADGDNLLELARGHAQGLEEFMLA